MNERDSGAGGDSPVEGKLFNIKGTIEEGLEGGRKLRISLCITTVFRFSGN